jgi:3-hydroxybutyryl-CoA dehydrogenase
MKYHCESCGREWDYPVEVCIFCDHPVSNVDVSSYEVQSITQVFISSDDHPITPYYVMLLRDSDGSYKFQKTFQNHEKGEIISLQKDPAEEFILGVIGTGLTGRGIVEVAAKTGNKVILKGRSEASLKKAIDSISKSLSKSMNPNESKNIIHNIILTTDFEPLIASNIIIESVVENLDIKRDIIKKLDLICRKDVILASNTSSLSISQIAGGLNHPERVLGLHFFNPIPKMKLVEIIKAKQTSDEALEKSRQFVKRLNKDMVLAEDTSGFIVNRLLFIMINEACHILDRGVAKIEDVDKAMKLGANYPMGPFELADLIGLDLCLEIIENLNKSSRGNEFEPSEILKDLVEKGHYGRKSNVGFYNYRSGKNCG